MLKPVLNGINQYLIAEACTAERNLMCWSLENNAVLICLHKWGAHEHPTMINPNITPGNGLILYFKTGKMNDIRKNAEKIGWPSEEDIHVNPNSTKKEFSMKTPDGYYLTVTEYHEYEG